MAKSNNSRSSKHDSGVYMSQGSGAKESRRGNPPTTSKTRTSVSPSRRTRVRFEPDAAQSSQGHANPMNDAPVLEPRNDSRQHGRRSASPSRPAAKKARITETARQKQERDHDTMIARRLTALRDSTRKLCLEEFDFNIKGEIDPTFIKAPPQLISYVGCIAIGGPNGREGWRELIDHRNLRKALVFGIISRVMEVHVLRSLCFGASDKLINQLTSMEKKSLDEDGFQRSAERAAKILEAGTMSTARPALAESIVRLTIQLKTMLQPIRDLSIKPKCSNADSAYTRKLELIIQQAADLNYEMRITAGVVYFQRPLVKDMEFDVKEMTCENLPDMRKDCPLPIYDEHGGWREANDPRGDPSDKALVRIAISWGCDAYRKGGGDYADIILADEAWRKAHSLPPELRGKDLKNKERVITRDDGVRMRMLTKGLAAMRWGKPELDDLDFAQNYKDLYDVHDDMLMAESLKATAGCLVM